MIQNKISLVLYVHNKASSYIILNQCSYTILNQCDQQFAVEAIQTHLTFAACFDGLFFRRRELSSIATIQSDHSLFVSTCVVGKY